MGSIVASVREWVATFQGRNPLLQGMPLQMALNHHFMKQDSSSQKCVCVFRWLDDHIM